jgi:hypothetical protein
MRYLCLFKPGKPETNTPPCTEEMATMAKLIEDMQKAGVFVMAEGCLPSAMGVRVQSDTGKGNFVVTDGPFAETKELISGFCMIKVKSKEEAIEWNKRFLEVVGGGTTELRLMHEFPAG